jgi:hypothetical protein
MLHDVRWYHCSVLRDRNVSASEIIMTIYAGEQRPDHLTGDNQLNQAVLKSTKHLFKQAPYHTWRAIKL